MRNIDILLAVKAEEIMHDYGRLSTNVDKPILIHPEKLVRNYIRVLPEDDGIVSIENSVDLVVKADIGDSIRYLVRTLNVETEYTAALVRFEPLQVVRDDVVPILSVPTIEEVTRLVPTVDLRNTLGGIDFQKLKDYHWVTKVNDLPSVGKQNSIPHLCVLAIYQKGSLEGYISIEPNLVLDNRLVL
ncbi:inclusion body protein [Xenorhabdus sp. Vera]|uniref:AidA/PixA family protein n=1 Tax=Xenorhabdus koppenhoeferi TaxID=351659 RepID=UPI0019B3A38B|nr:AidA/PixA family protein [Xenorhabdus sp. Vera]MBD2810281.1 inclusion body protein [Xenorhabdus sp. Vera]